VGWKQHFCITRRKNSFGGKSAGDRRGGANEGEEREKGKGE
jgi:hypothetical protein